MKKYLITLLLTFVILPGIVSAQTSLPDIGLLPDNSFYFLKSWKESIQLFFTFNAENKAKQYLYLAEVRMAEYQKMIEKGKTDIAEKTLTKYQNQLNGALSKAEEIKQKGKDIKDLSQQIETVTAKHLEVLRENLEKVPETARKGIETAIENSRKRIEKVLDVKINKEKEKENNEKEEGMESNNETSDWKIYRNEKYGFYVKYPQKWVLKDLITNPNQSSDSYDIGISYMSPAQNAVRGITYCEAYTNSVVERCEVFKQFIIDWEFGSTMTSDGNNGIVTLSLKKSSTERKMIFRKVLSTFKFINQ